MLSPRERHVIAERWLSPRRATLKALGHRFGVTTERARQIEASALRKLRKRAVALGIEP